MSGLIQFDFVYLGFVECVKTKSRFVNYFLIGSCLPVEVFSCLLHTQGF